MLRTEAWNIASQIALRDCYKEVREERGYVGGCCSVAQSCPTFSDPMNCGTAGLPVPHHLPEFTQVHVHCTGDAMKLWAMCVGPPKMDGS